MRKPVCLLIAFFSLFAKAQTASVGFRQAAVIDRETSNHPYSSLPPRKLFQRNHGVIIGLQRGRSTAIELGGEAHWRKLALKKPHIIGATGNMEYNFGDHVIGYKAGVWAKQGRINFTYGANVGYHTNFKGLHRYSLGPAIGFRFAGFHLINGYNFLGGDKELDKVNTLHMTMRYYFPLENKFTWDRKTMKKKKQRRKERDRRKEEREKEKEGREKKSLRELLRF
ncbi:MAG TPA: hypothetical protein VGB56_08330 [Flavisolibacter sp.]